MNKTALITGASGGIGLELARLFAADGIDLLLVARTESKLTEIKRELEEEYKIAVHTVGADLQQLSSLQKIYEYVAAADLQIEYLVNNAGFGDFGDFVESELERSRQMISLNVETPVALTWHFAGEMLKRGRGKILNTASIAAFQPVPNMAIYGATKAFLLSFTEALRYELRKSGISVTALCPGPTDTGFFTRARSPFVRMQRSMTTPQQVALSGYRAMKRGKMYIIPGFSNKIMGFFAQVIPCNKMVLQLAAKMTEKV